jgi:tryptophanyl-tRNA synthetase
MTTLENLYNGNIEPTDSESLKNNMRYKEGLRLVGRLQEELAEMLNEEQKELFEKYLTAANELSIVINEETFKTGYRLATQIMIECM